MSDFQINALLTETGVNMGDHAQNVTTAIEVDPAMPIGDLCRQVLTKLPPYAWDTHPSQQGPDVKCVADGTKFLTLRLAVKP